MNSLSISQLKTNPGGAILKALDFPVAIQKRNHVQAYLVGKDLYERIISHLEGVVDSRAIRQTDFSIGKDFEAVAEKLGI